MKARCSALMLAIAMVLSCATAQWAKLGVGTLPTSFAVIGSTIYVGTAGDGIWYSIDDGFCWKKSISSPTNPTIQSLLAHDTTLFAVTTSGIFHTSDRGHHWLSANYGLPASNGEYHLGGCLAEIDNDLYTYANRQFYRSTDHGEQWVPTGFGLPVGGTLTYLGGFGTIRCAGVSSGWNPRCGLFISTDGGASWVEANSGMRDQHGNGPNVSAVVAKDSTLFVATGWGVFCSTDTGKTWLGANSGLPQTNGSVHAVHSLACDGSNLLAGTTHDGVYISSNNGATWTETNSGLLGKDVSLLAFTGSNVIVGTGCGVFCCSPVKVKRWIPVVGLGPFLDGRVQSCLSRGQEIFIEVDRGSSCASNFYSSDNGGSWTIRTDAGYKAMIFVGDDILAARDNQVYRSTDGGKIWHSSSRGLPAAEDVRVTSMKTCGQWIFASTSLGIYGSSDGGVSWIERTAGMGGAIATQLAVSGSILFAGTEGRGMFKTADDGATWTSINTGFPQIGTNPRQLSYVSCLAATDHDIFAGTGSGLYRIPRDGDAWSSLNSWIHMGDDSLIYCVAAFGNHLFVGTAMGGVIRSTDNGHSWVSIDEGMPIPPPGSDPYVVLSLAVCDSFLFACPARTTVKFPVGWGLWRRPLSEITVSVQDGDMVIAKELALMQNYPNPFNPSTTIRYGLPIRAHVTLSVFNTLGQQVSILQNGEQEAGSHEVRFDGSNLPSGVYFYRMQAGTYTETKRLLLVR